MKAIRECYYPARGCHHNEDMECYAPVYDHLKCQGSMEDDTRMAEWERLHEPPEDHHTSEGTGD